MHQISAEDLGAWWEVEVNIGINGDYSLPMGIARRDKQTGVKRFTGCVLWLLESI